MSKKSGFISEDEYLRLSRDLNNMEYEVKRSEALTNILQLLESEQPFERVVADILKIVGEFLQVSNVSLYKWDEKGENIVSILEWIPDSGVPLLSLVSNEFRTEYIKKCMESGITEYVADISERNSVLEELGIKALLVVPVNVNGKSSMYIGIADTDPDRRWRENTIQFCFDVAKIIQNILLKRIDRNSLISSYTALKEILDNVGSGLFVIDKDTKKILFANNTMKLMANDDMEGKFCNSFGYCGMKHNCEKCDVLDKACIAFETYATENHSWYDIKFNEISWVDGRKVSLCNIQNITEKKKIEKRIEFQANNDFLTGLYNRMSCENDMEKYIALAEENDEHGYVMFLDLDNFKHINDGLGHQYGDMLLKMISLGLQQIKGIENSCYRMGGDEFVIIVVPSEKKRLPEILKEIKYLFNKPWDLNGTEYYCTMSMGIVSYPDDGHDVNELIKKADIAMYSAKKAGKNRIEYYNNKEESSSIKRLDLEKNMRRAIAIGGNEFEVYIQPIVDTYSEECIGGEALIRWNCAKLGFITPNDFIPLAEHLGLIIFIGELFLRRVCSILKKWSDMGINKKIHINLSIVQLVQNNIVEVIKEVIKDTGVNPANIVLEVTESLAINDINHMKRVIREIKELGIEIALDDFGTGYSSLNYIKQMDFDIIKVDKIFIDDIVSDDYAQTFVKLITELSDKLNVKVCIEGVETREQFDTLRDIRVSMIQGYLFGKPIPYRDYERKFLGIEKYDEFKEGKV
ncbi:MAG: GGDEF domain-containing protein [Lachnospiraceae bacterium]|nr:GGDEF domain-containing protein [Lachnospiraceae bacterium]